MTGSALLTGGDRLAPGRHRSLAATVEWSYRLLGEEERRVFRAVSVFPGPFTLEAAEAVAGPGAGEMVLRLVDCSLVVPPREGPDGRWRYAMLQTLRAYGAGLLAGSGEQDAAEIALARWAAEVAGQAAAGLQTVEGEAAAARWLDAEDATTAVRCWPGPWSMMPTSRCGWWPGWAGGGTCGPGWRASTRCCARPPGAPCRAATDGAPCSSLRATRRGFPVIRPRRWAMPPRCGTQPRSGGRARRWPTAWPAGRRRWPSWAGTPRRPSDARRALAVAREIAYPLGQVLALGGLAFAAQYADDLDGAVRLARQAGQITAGIPGSMARWCGYVLAAALIEAGDLAAAETVCAAALAQARDTGDLQNQAILLSRAVILDLEAGRLQDAAAHLREAIQLDTRIATWGELQQCPGLLRAAVRGDRASRRGRHGVGRARRARCGTKRLRTRPRRYAAGKGRCAGPGRRSAPAGPAQPNSAARR